MVSRIWEKESDAVDSYERNFPDSELHNDGVGEGDDGGDGRRGGFSSDS